MVSLINASGQSKDPGVQNIWGGLVGATFVIGFYWGYALYRLYALPDGGPVVGTLFSYLPEWFRFHNVNRDYFDILAILALAFLLMAAWERSVGRFALPARATLLLTAGACIWSAWQAPATILRLGPHAVTGIEMRFLASAMAILAVWLLWRGARSWAEDRGKRPAKAQAPRATWTTALKSGFVRWASLLVLFTAALMIYNGHRYYVGYPRNSNEYFSNWRMTVTILWTAFAGLGLPYAVWSARRRRGVRADMVDPGLMIFLVYRTVGRALAFWDSGEMSRLGNRRIRHALLDLLVKAFFLPLMISFLYIEAGGFNNAVRTLVENSSGSGIRRAWDIVACIGRSWAGVDPSARGQLLFTTLAHWLRRGIFVMDVSLGTLGYACSFWWLGNKSKSVDSTLSGWAVALICYPPFNQVSDLYFPYAHEAGPAWAFFQQTWIQNSLLALMVACFAVYVWATMAFALRFSNLTNRGIISCGPYAFLRHPAYISKNLAWWAESLPNFGHWTQPFYLLGLNLIYFLRAFTEERHLNSDPDYQTYRRRVRYRFIPRVW